MTTTFYMIANLLLSQTFCCHKTLLGSMAQLFVNLGVGLEIW